MQKEFHDISIRIKNWQDQARHTLSLPPSWLTASTKASWSSGVHRMRVLLEAALAEEEGTLRVRVSTEGAGEC